MDFLKENGFIAFKHDPGGAYTKRRLSVHRKCGVSDIIGITKTGQFLAIEVKTKEGKASELQLEFINKVNQTGGVAFIAKSIQDVIDEFKVRGVFSDNIFSRKLFK